MSTIFISHSSDDNALAKELAERLEQQNHRSVFLDFDPERGIVAGKSWEQTLYRKLRACRAVIVVCTDNYLSSQWCFAEIALARMEGKYVVALQSEPWSKDARRPSILAERQFIDMRTNSEDGYRRLWQGLKEQDLLGVVGEWDPKKPPYLGLSAYQEEHAPVFFGREDESRAGLELLSRGAPGLVMVLGSSGSGKSSLVRAGMLPRLRREQGQWLVVDPFRPGGDPYIELAESLLQTWRRYAPEHAARVGNAEEIRRRLYDWTPTSPTSAAPQPESTEDGPIPGADQRVARLIQHIEELRNDPPAPLQDGLRHFLDWSLDDLQRIAGGPALSAAGGVGAESTPLVDLARELRRDAKQRNASVLLIVDQFEENLGHGEADHNANRFLALLRASIEADHSPLIALGTMRSDFLGVFQRNAALRGIDFASLSLGPVRLDGMRRIIEEPARLSALELEAGLAERLIKDTETPDALPLLSFTLSVLWRDYRDDGKLEVSEYEQLGGLNGAIAREADVLLGSAKTDGKEDALRKAFLRMARLTEEGGYARQPVAWDTEELRPVHSHLERFVERRLLVTRAEGGARMVEVAHEALFRSWTPLKTWLDNNRAELLLQMQISRDAKAWHGNQRAAENLWRGGRLQEAQKLAREGQLGEPEREFVRASWRRRRLLRLTAAAATLTVIAVLSGFLVYALMAADRAEKATEIANSGRLAGASLVSRSDRPDRASLLALEALHTADTFDARNALLLAVQSNPRLIASLDNADSLAFASNEILATGNVDGTVRLWRLDESGATLLGKPPAGDGVSVQRVAIKSDGKTLASGNSEGTVRIWRLDESGAMSPGEPLRKDASAENAVFDFTRDGKMLATATVDGNLQLWRLSESGATPLGNPLPGGGMWVGVTSAAFTPDGRTLAYAAGGIEPKVWLWRLDESGTTPLGNPLSGFQKVVESVAFAPNGEMLATGGPWEEARLWRLHESGATLLHVLREPDFDDVTDVAFASDELLATGHMDGRVGLWRFDESGATLEEPLAGGPTLPVYNIAFTPDGKTLASRTEGDLVWIWRLDDSDETSLGQLLKGDTGRVNEVAFAPDGMLATGSEDGKVRLWRLGESGAALQSELPSDDGSSVAVNSVAIASNGELLASGSAEGDVRLWQLDDSGVTSLGKLLAGDGSPVTSVAFARDGKTLAAGSLSGEVRLWRLDESGATSLTPFSIGEENSVGSIAFASDGMFATGSDDGKVRLWRLDESGTVSQGEPLDYAGGEVSSVTFTRDAKTLAAAGEHGEVWLWRLDGSGDATALGEPLVGDGTWVTSVAFSANGEMLASGDADETVRLWWLDESGATLLGEPIAAHRSAISSVAFAPDGKTLATSSADSGGDSTVRLWPVDIESWQAAACRRPGSNFSLAEWNKYMGTSEPYRCTCPAKGPGKDIPACP